MLKKYTLYLLVLFISQLVFAAGSVVIIEITPGKVALKPGQKYNFSANAFDVDGNEVFFRPEWQASGGTINQDGVFIAGSTTGVYEVIASHSKNGAHTSSIVTIGNSNNYYVPPKPKNTNTNTKNKNITNTSRLLSLQLIPRSISVKPRQKIQFIVQAYDNFGNRVKPPKRLLWKVSGGSITRSGLYQAGGASGAYTIQVGNYNGIVANAQVYINFAPGRISRVEISPSYINLKPGDQYRFFATAYNSAGKIMAFTPRWQATGGSIDSSGRFYAYNTSGTHRVTAYSNNNIAGSASINIKNTYVTDAEVYPKGAILYPGQSQQFIFKAYGRDGALLNLYPSWSATGGVIQANGLYRAGYNSGDYTLTGSVNNFNVNVKIRIRNEKQLSNIQISPSRVKLRTGQNFQFTISGYDTNGNKTKIRNLNIESNGGKIDSNGMYIAGEKPGKYEIKISSSSGLFSTTKVHIVGDTNYNNNIDRNTNNQVIDSNNSIDSNIKNNTIKNNTDNDNNIASGNKNNIDTGSEIDNDQGNFSSGTENETSAVKWLTIAPQFAPTIPGRKTQFTVKGYDGTGKEIPCNAVWRSTGGKITTNGLYTADSALGNYKVQVSVGSIKALAKVIINKAPKNIITKEKEKEKPKENPLLIIPPKIRLKPGETCDFNAQVTGKTAQDLNLKWSADAGKVNNKGNYIAPNEAGEYTITVEDKALKLKREVSVVVEGTSKQDTQQFAGNNAIEFDKWYVKTNKSGLATIHIKGKILLESTAMLKLLLHRNGDEELVYQLHIKEKQRFTIQGTHYVAGASKLELVLYDSNKNVVHRESK